jgi:ABC-type transport system involved in multi-copper enzyme maturation permease subunit
MRSSLMLSTFEIYQSFFPVAQVNEYWVRSWLQPIWFLGTGVGIGLLALAICLLIFRALSYTPFSQLAKSNAGHWVAGAITVGLALAMWKWRGIAFGDPAYQEPVLNSIAAVLMCAIIGWAIVFCSGKQAAKNSLETLSEGVSGYIGVTALSVVFLAAFLWAFGSRMANPIVDGPEKILKSIPQAFTSGPATQTIKIAGKPQDADAPFVEIPIPEDFEIVRSLSINTTTTVILADAPEVSKVLRTPVRIVASEPIRWIAFQPRSDLPFGTGPGSKVYIQNQEIDETEITIDVTTQPRVPQAGSLVLIAFGTFLFGLAILLQNAVAPRVSAVALATIKNELGQPLFLVLMLIGATLILLFVFLSFNTFGEDIKLLKDCGITIIMLLAAFQGVWSASSSVSEEIEGRTALTVLSKPIQRRSFVIGKFMGLFWILALMFIVLGSLELIAVAYKPLYDAKESSIDMPGWQICYMEVLKTIPGLLMAFMQAILLTAVSVALATRVPLLANLSICLSIYLIGNLSTSIVSSTVDAFPIVEFIAQLVATIIPILEHFQMQSAIDADKTISASLLAGNLIYCLLYVMLAMFLALILFEDRDLA